MPIIFSVTNRVDSVYSASLGWRCDIIDDNGRQYIRFYNSDQSGAVRGPWMSIPVRGVDGKWSIGDRQDFAREIDKFMRDISETLKAHGIDHLG
jgi:hypothetical protein